MPSTQREMRYPWLTTPVGGSFVIHKPPHVLASMRGAARHVERLHGTRYKIEPTEEGTLRVTRVR